MEIRTEFAKWFSRMCKYGFFNKMDYFRGYRQK
ncbi:MULTISPECIES: hypothetical protein [Enterocloster]